MKAYNIASDYHHVKHFRKDIMQAENLSVKKAPVQAEEFTSGGKVHDMTKGSPMKLILGFSLPMLMGLLFQQFYSLADTVIVGRFIGVNALAAVGSTASINFFIIGFCTGVCSGFSIPVAQCFGARDYKGLRKYVANSIWLSILFAVIMTFFVVLFCMPILKLMNTPSDIINRAYSFIVIIFLGIPATYLYNLTSGIIRSLGDSKTPVYFLLLASVMNVALDLLFIVVLHTDVYGAACATVISQLAAGISCLVYMIRKFPILQISREEARLDFHSVRILCSMGIPMGLQYSITAIGSVILQTSVNGLGSSAVAAVTASTRISNFIVCPFDAMGATMATYGGQNVGARELQRVKDGLRSCVFLGFCYAVISFLILLLFSRHLLLFFISAEETQILQNAELVLMTTAAFYFLLALVDIVRFLIQGMGFSGFAVLSGVFEMIARTFAGFVLVPSFGFIAVALASPIAWLLADCFLIPAFFHVSSRLERLFSGISRPAC